MWFGMKVLLDTNIIIHRERIHPIEKEIGKLFWWIDKLGYRKFIHQKTMDEIHKIQDEKKLEAFSIKLESYNVLPTEAEICPEIQEIIDKFDKTKNDSVDSILLNEVVCNRVDYLITEDRAIHRKAAMVNVDERVFTIDGFLEKANSENPDLLDYEVLSIRRDYFGNINLKDDFFNCFREDYIGYEKWYSGKSDETAYVCISDDKIVAFLYLKIEDEKEPYNDIEPTFSKKKRLKIGALKVTLNGFKLGERFLKIIFDNALNLNVEEIYVTIFPKRIEQQRLIALLKEYGFEYHGSKRTESGEEEVYIRDFKPKVSSEEPKSNYPYMSSNTKTYIVPIYPAYHTELFPDSILKNESPIDFIENEPFRNAISKVYISRSINRDLKPGDIIIFYRTGGLYKSVITTLGIVESIHTNIKDYDHFISLCRKRTVFSDDELKLHWDYNPRNRPFVVNFLYVYSFPHRLNMKRLIELGIIKDINSAPRGFELLTKVQLDIIISETNSNESIIVN
jgi:predicted nucleic acid-binding protein